VEFLPLFVLRLSSDSLPRFPLANFPFTPAFGVSNYETDREDQIQTEADSNGAT
jgi:hypothetical protein